MAALRLLPALVALAACGDPSDCEAMSGKAREECRYQAARAVADDDAALRAALDRIPDPMSRDVVILRLAVDTPTRAPALCAMTTTPVGRDKCEKVVGRPHLGGGPQGPPPAEGQPPP